MKQETVMLKEFLGWKCILKLGIFKILFTNCIFIVWRLSTAINVWPSLQVTELQMYFLKPPHFLVLLPSEFLLGTILFIQTASMNFPLVLANWRSKVQRHGKVS